MKNFASRNFGEDPHEQESALILLFSYSVKCMRQN